MKRKKLMRILMLESVLRQQAETLLDQARGQLAEGVLREEALARQAEEADGLRLVMERALHSADEQIRRQARMLRECGIRVDFLTGETVTGLPTWANR